MIPPQIPEVRPKMERITEFTKEYWTLKAGKFFKKNRGKKKVVHEPPKFLKNAPVKTNLLIGLLSTSLTPPLSASSPLSSAAYSTTFFSTFGGSLTTVKTRADTTSATAPSKP